MPTTRTLTTKRHQVRRIGMASALAALLAVAAVGCDSSSDSDRAKKASSQVTTTAATTAATETTTSGQPASGGGQASGNSGGSSSGGGTSSGGTSSGGGQPTGTAPTIDSFTTPDDIDCHNGNLQNFTASWSTSNAVKVTISIDGPGIYDTYGPSGDVTLPFNCSTSHTFLLTAYGSDGQTATTSVTLQPRNVQTADDTDATTGP